LTTILTIFCQNLIFWHPRFENEIANYNYLVTATPLVEPKKKAQSWSEENYMSAALRRAATSNRNIRAYQTEELENLYKELLSKR